MARILRIQLAVVALALIGSPIAHRQRRHADLLGHG